MQIIFCIFGTVFHIISAQLSQKSYQFSVQASNDPLILTQWIKKGQIDEAQLLSQVNDTTFLMGVKSYSGYFTVNAAFNSNTFFWFFPAENDYKNAPVILWLQGGPGYSSLFGLFLENGPFVIQEDNTTLRMRDVRWTKTFSVLYIDNPVGTGFSFTDDGGYARNETQIGEELYEALQQFFKMFPELQKNDFYIAGESYAGKYVPAIAYAILKHNLTAREHSLLIIL